MNKKEQTPLAVHKAIEPYLDKEDSIFVRVDSEKDLIRFRGSEIDSNFFFHIKSHRNRDNKNQINIEYQPYTVESVVSRVVWIDCNEKNINTLFEIWVKLLKEYKSTRTVFDDPITEGFKDEYYSYFEIVDEEKYKPLEHSSIIPLYEHFEEIRLRLNDYKTEDNTSEIEVIQEEIIELNNRLTNTGRQEIAKRICKIWARLTKQGIKYIKEFVDESRKYIMQEAAKRVFQLGQKGLDYIEDLNKILN